MQAEFFLVEDRDSAVLIKLNRPTALNALNRALLKELSGLLAAIDRRDDVRAVILTGAGEKAFAAGADIAEMSKMSAAEAREFSHAGQKVMRQIEKLRVPVIAAVNGFALGGGCELALSCDFIIAAKNAVFGQPEVGLGLIPGFGGTVRLSRFVGESIARELIFTGRRVKSDEAYRIGLVNRVVEPEKLLDEALQLARDIGSQSPSAVRNSKAAMNLVREKLTSEEKLDAEATAFGEAFTTEDYREGVDAFLGKRKPAFRGR